MKAIEYLGVLCLSPFVSTDGKCGSDNFGLYRSADESLARPSSRYIFFDS